MYNRYIRNDRGIYTRITEEDGEARERESGPPHESPPEAHGPPSGISGPESAGPPRESPPQFAGPPPERPSEPPPRNLHGPPPRYPPSGPQNPDALSGFLRRFIGPSPLDRFDADDLLLLGLLFLLYREGADEETVLALGLLLLL